MTVSVNWAAVKGVRQIFSRLASSAGSSLIGFLQAGTGAVSRTAQDKMRETISAKDFGALGDGTTDDTAAIQAAIDYAETFTEGKNPSVYLPAGEYVVSETITISRDGFLFYGDGIQSWLRPTISDGTACLKIAAGCGQWRIDGIRIEARLASEANYISGTANAQACIGLDAYQTGSNFITRFQIGFLRVKNCATGIKLGAFIGTVQDALVINCELGLNGTILNDVTGDMRFENCRKSYSITDSIRIKLNVLEEGTAALNVASTIDNCTSVTISSYYEWDTANRTEPFLTVGDTTEVKDFNFSGSVGGATTGIYQLKLNRVDGAIVGGCFNLGTREGSIQTTSNTKNLTFAGTLTASTALQDDSKQLGVAYNYFPNRSFDLWFRGWGNVAAVRSTLSQETTLVRKGANAVKILCTAGQNSNYVQWVLNGPSVAYLRGKTLVLGMWIWVPDQSAFDNSSPTALPGPVLQSYNGSDTTTSSANNSRALRNAWNFIMTELAIQSDATEIQVIAFANQSNTNAAGTEYIVVDSIVLCEKSTPLKKIYNGELIDSPYIDAIAVAGRMILYASAAPSDADQVFANGDQVYLTTMAAGSSPGSICTTGGAGGVAVFKGMASLAA